MNLKDAEKISEDPDSVSGEIRKEAFDWADKKRFDVKATEEVKQRATEVVSKIWKYAEMRANINAPKRMGDVKKVHATKRKNS